MAQAFRAKDIQQLANDINTFAATVTSIDNISIVPEGAGFAAIVLFTP